ncbi:histidine phosphatase family protein [Palleronia sediminis]|uniref:Histidine phosphatase family protein n=1 Tax=Palleronia sediminis TaxID=2547833 RepID=A0A4R6A0E6_9RHOB|nr:histidine phosphatase family protein [Palleronia sediminis]TDL76022.1 histidine phosphatase family protein [Palleronia sediminis]
MGEIVLVRHGQANSHATTEEDYDRLSPLGHRQAERLGAWLEARGERFDRVISGTLRRHRETAAAMGHTGPETDARLNEMDYFNLGEALRRTKGVPMPPDADGFAAHMPQVMRAWHDAEIQGNESFASFETRITGALIDAAEEGRRVLCVTSGGVIGMVMRHILDLDPHRLSMVLLPILNTSVHRIHVRGPQMILGSFNAVPHLDAPDLMAERTHF